MFVFLIAKWCFASGKKVLTLDPNVVFTVGMFGARKVFSASWVSCVSSVSCV